MTTQALRPALAYGLVSAVRRSRDLVLPALTVATGAVLLVLVMALMPAVRQQGAAFGDSAGVGRAAVALSALVLLVGALEVAITATRSITQRTREIGVLCSFGVAPGSVVCGLIVEPVATSFVGGAAGAVLGAFTVAVGTATGWIPGAVPARTLLVAGAIAVAVSTVAAAVASAAPAVRAAYRPPLVALSS